MRRIRIPLLLAVVLASTAALTATGLASLPHADSKLITPNKSIGGVKLGDSFGDAKDAWGKGKCTKTTSVHVCSYTPKNSADGNASYSGKAKGPVTQVQIATGFGSSDYNFDTPLKKFKTKKDIGIGSLGSDVKDAYPGAKRQKVAPFSANFEYVLSNNKSVTLFQLNDAPKERVIAVIVHFK
jgi:hypothetical protein